MSVSGTLSPREIEAAIERLTPDQVAELARWFRARFEDAWDLQIEADVQAGRLDLLVREAVAEYEAGRTTELPPSAEPGD